MEQHNPKPIEQTEAERIAAWWARYRELRRQRELEKAKAPK
jgi:hypothetical protein